MLLALLVLLLIVAILYLATLGAVLLVRFVLGSENRTGRVVAATLIGPVTVIMPIMLLGWVDNSDRSLLELAGIFLVLMAMCCALGWPVAQFATRRLDRETRFDPQMFE